MMTLAGLYRTLLALIALCALGTAWAGETVTYFHNDAAGSPVLATDVNGLQVWKETYRPYGDRLIQSAASATNDVWFAGASVEEGSGLSYMGARYYDAAIGRFIAVDPLRVNVLDLHSLNRYAYANNNPFKFVDPAGENAIAIEDVLVTGTRLGGEVIKLNPWGFLIFTLSSTSTADRSKDQICELPPCYPVAYSEEDASADKAGEEQKETAEKPQEIPKVKPGDGKRAYDTNKKFRRWFHKEYKPDVKTGSKSRHNPDEDLDEGYEQWLGEGRPTVD